MQLAENLGKTRGEVMAMPTDEIAAWMGYYKAKAAKREQDKAKTEAKTKMTKKARKHAKR